MYRPMDGFTVSTTTLPDGDQGTKKTLDNMRRLADQGSRDLSVRGTVAAWLRANARPHDVVGQIRAWFEYVRDCIYFLHDPHNTEWLQTPRYTLSVGAGDCDDKATLLAAGLRAFGVPAQFKAVAVDRSRPRTFSHVYVIVPMPGGGELALDPTYRENLPGVEPAYPSRVMRASA